MYTYAGIGSRKTPLAVQKEMTKAAEFLKRHNWILRSGGAQGADTAFEKGVSADWLKQIYRPTHVLTPQHYEIAAAHHPVWGQLVPYVKQLHARNVAILLGDDCKSPVSFGICWAPNPIYDTKHIQKSCAGGTGQGVRVAYSHNIRVYNVIDPHDTYELKERLQQIKYTKT